jgi:hypothetical protein
VQALVRLVAVVNDDRPLATAVAAADQVAGHVSQRPPAP